MSTGRQVSGGGGLSAGFTALELLLGVVLTVVLAAGAAPLVLSIQDSGVRDTDRTVKLMQSRVAVARLERDLRTATAGECAFAPGGPILQASPQQLVFLGRRVGEEGLFIIEWEIVGSALMRRWGPCPSERPDEFAHSLYVDNKTMLEGLASEASFAYLIDGALESEAPTAAELRRVSDLTLRGGGKDSYGSWTPFLDAEARVGR